MRLATLPLLAAISGCAPTFYKGTVEGNEVTLVKDLVLSSAPPAPYQSKGTTITGDKMTVTFPDGRVDSMYKHRRHGANNHATINRLVAELPGGVTYECTFEPHTDRLYALRRPGLPQGSFSSGIPAGQTVNPVRLEGYDPLLAGIHLPCEIFLWGLEDGEGNVLDEGAHERFHEYEQILREKD